MVRTTNRHLTRLFFLLVLGMAFFGGWYADRNWRIEPPTFDQTSEVANGDWIEFASSLGEQAIQIFLGLTSSSK
ncbi:MAG: hypothetical protein NT075_07130 [Chloroflexi bacterium]|jgi:hypothetical protein|nr:hypothetical protein [Chloroflexota bacterium]